MISQEITNVCSSILSANLSKIDEMARRTRSAALEHWFQCELIISLLNKFSGQYDDLITEWYYPKRVVPSPKGPAQPDIILFNRSTLKKQASDPFQEKTAQSKLIEGVYLELKTSIHNKYSPRPQRSNILKKLENDYRRVQKVNSVAKANKMATQALSIGLIIDSTPINIDQRKPCRDLVATWIQESTSLQNYLLNQFEFSNGYGISLYIWSPT